MVSKKSMASTKVDFPFKNPIFKITSPNQKPVPQDKLKINGL
jgi:hypothetical protein